MRTQLPERNLDVLRAVAVLCVVVDHFSWPFTNGALWRVGLFGVFLFFVHTSLVLMASLERLDEQTTSTGQRVGAFYLRRVFRIYPLAWAALALVLVGHLPAGVETLPPAHPPQFVRPSVAEFVTNLTLTQNIGPDHRSLLGVLWTLPIEVQMYLLLPALWWLARREDRGRGFVTVLVLALPVGLLARYAFPQWPILWRVPSIFYYAPCFLGGVLAYRVLWARQRHGQSARFPAWTWAIALALAVVLFWGARVTSLANAWRGWAACLALGLAIPFVRDLSDSWLTRAAKQVATYSYGIYLLHVPAQWTGFVLLHRAPWAVQWSVSLALVAVLPVLAYRVIEQPGIHAGQWAATRWVAWRAAARGRSVAAPEIAPAPSP